MKRFLFVSGSPRSGTSALAKIVGWGPRCFMGQERFNLLSDRNEHEFVPGLFEPGRIRDFRKFDCGYESFEDLRGYYSKDANPEMIPGIDNAVFLGDKSISLWRNFSIFDLPAWKDQSIRVFHIVRNVTDVAASYQARFERPNDKWTADYQKGVDVWSRSVDKAYAWMTSENVGNHQMKIFIISYEALFDSGEDRFILACERIFSEAGFEFNRSHLEGPRKVFLTSHEVKKKRTLGDELIGKITSITNSETLRKFKLLEKMSIV